MAGEADITITGGTIVSDSFVSEGVSVDIWTTKLDHNLDKPLISVEKPRSATDKKEDADAGLPEGWESYLIDIGKVKEMITVQGMLIDETTESALEKKKNLMRIFGNHDSIQITWGTGNNAQTYAGSGTKCMVTETPGIIGIQKSGYYSEKNFAVQFAIQVGTPKINHN